MKKQHKMPHGKHSMAKHIANHGKLSINTPRWHRGHSLSPSNGTSVRFNNRGAALGCTVIGRKYGALS